MNKSSICLTVQSNYRDLNQKEKAVADYILKDPKRASRSTISDIASASGVADSTVFQFTRRMGYRGFKDFKIDLLTDEFDAKVSIHEHIAKNDSCLDIAKKVFLSSRKTLDNTKKLLSEQQLIQAHDILMSSQTINFFGVGESGIVAEDAYHRFLRTPLTCRHSIDYHQQLILASLLSKSDCAVLISHTGLSHETIEIAKIAKANHAKIIVITSYPLSALAKMGDVVFISSAEETSYRSESMSSRLSHLVFIDILYVLVMVQDEEASSHSLKKVRKVIFQTKEQ